MAAIFSNNRDAWGALFFTSVVNPPEPAEIPIQRQHKRKEGKEPATIIREDFNWDGEDDVWLRTIWLDSVPLRSNAPPRSILCREAMHPAAAESWKGLG